VKSDQLIDIRGHIICKAQIRLDCEHCGQTRVQDLEHDEVLTAKTDLATAAHGLGWRLVTSEKYQMCGIICGDCMAGKNEDPKDPTVDWVEVS
jgi:hypothetical protein